MTELFFIFTSVFIIYCIESFISNDKSKYRVYEKQSEYKDNQKSNENQSKITSNIHTYYDNLKVARNAPDSVIKAAYKALMQNYHPDKFKGSEQEALRIAKIIRQSYDVLIDPVSRAEYDRWIDEQAKKQNEKVQFGEAREINKKQNNQQQEKQDKYSSASNYKSSDDISPALSGKYGEGIWLIVIIGLLLFYAFGASAGVHIVWFGDLFASALPSTIVWYALGALVTYKLRVTKSIKIAGFFLAWLITSILALMMAKESSASSASLEMPTAGFIGAIVALFLISILKSESEYKKPVFIIGAIILVILVLMPDLENNNLPQTLTQSNEQVQNNPNTQQPTPAITASTNTIKDIQKRAEQGDTKAQEKLGSMYLTGQGVALDFYQAAYWFRKSAEQGNDAGQFEIGLLHYFGSVQAQDGSVEAPNYNQAAYWFSKSAEQGNSKAQAFLGSMYLVGQGAAIDYNQAAYWFRKAAEQGISGSQRNLGLMYSLGQGVAQDYNQAVYWFKKAAEQGDDIAVKELKKLNIPINKVNR